MSNVQDEDGERRKDTAHNALVCKIRRFEMIKYSFGQDEEYVAIKESLVVEMCILAKPIGIKSFIRLFGITIALIKVSAAEEERRVKSDILLVQVYVDDIIFGSTKNSLYIEFEKMMHKKFKMSYVGKLTFFLGLQVKQKEDGIFICQDKYVTEILKKFSFTDVKIASTPMETQKPLLKDADGEDVDEHLYRSMNGSLMYLTSSRPDI
ncbi:uncharacterized mitochondrial protein-like protein, partial [Tanacetum coccineum]